MQIKPFAALRPTTAKVSAVASVPYDVVDRREAAELAAGNPDSLLHVSRPEIDLPDEVDVHDDRVYAQGLSAFKTLQRGTLIREPAECYYLYRQIMGAHCQIGIVLCCNIEDYENNLIRRHEKTRKDKEDDRTRHTLTLRANTGPVFLTYRDIGAINHMVDSAITSAPVYDFTAADGIKHTVWRVSRNLDNWTALLENIPITYIADGHHRAAAAFRAGSQCRNENPKHTGDEEYNWFLAVLFPASHLRVLPYNRCVLDLNGLSTGEFIGKVSEVFEVTPAMRPMPSGPGRVKMYIDRRWYRLSWNEVSDDPVDRLDVSVLQQRLLAPILDIQDPRTSQRIEFVGGIRGEDELVHRVDSGVAAVAFSMFPVTVGQVMDIADAGEIMPPKSTWFEPKLRSGLLIHTF